MTVRGGGFKLIIVPDGLVHTAKGYVPHPAVSSLLPRRGRRRWAAAPCMTALEWYAWSNGWNLAPALLLAAKAKQLPQQTQQVWLATPYRAVLMRDTVRVAPLTADQWDAAKAGELARLLVQLLAPVGMHMIPMGAALLVASERKWRATPHTFAHLCVHGLPDRHAQGADGGSLMRLHAEMEMLLARHADEVDGIWFWGAGDWPAPNLPHYWPNVTTDDAHLAAISSGEGAQLAIFGAEQVTAEMQARCWLLAAEGVVLLIDGRGIMPLRSSPWNIKRTIPLAALRRVLPL